MSAFKIEVADGPARAAVTRLIEVEKNPDPVLRTIGEDWLGITHRAFETSHSPDGAPWAPNSQVVYEAIFRRTKGNFRKDGKLSAKGAGRVMAKKPLIGESGFLSGASIVYNVAKGTLEFGSSSEYAAMQQLGGTKEQFPNLWGDIPARPFIPIYPDGQLMEPAQLTILDAFNEAIAATWRG